MVGKLNGDLAVDGDSLSLYLTRFRDALADFFASPSVDELCEVASWAQGSFAFLSAMETRYGADQTNAQLAEECEGIEWEV